MTTLLLREQLYCVLFKLGKCKGECRRFYWSEFVYWLQGSSAVYSLWSLYVFVVSEAAVWNLIEIAPGNVTCQCELWPKTTSLKIKEVLAV